MQKSIAKDLVFMVWYHEYMDGFLNYLDTLMEREEIAPTPYGFVKVMQYVDFEGNNIEKYRIFVNPVQLNLFLLLQD
jgi:hypothetical protein